MNIKPKILVVSESIDVEDSSGSKANVSLIKNLKKAGFELRVYHYSRKEIILNDIDTVSIKEKRRSFLFLLSRIERYLRKLINIQLHKPLEKIFGFSFTLLNDRNSIVSGLKKDDWNPDLVLTLSKGGSFRPHHALLEMPQWHKKWLAYIHDPYPMHLYPRPYAWVEPGYYKKWKFVKEVSEKAAYKAFPSKLLQNWMGSYFPDFNRNSVIIPHQITKESTGKNDPPSFFDHEFFNILHAGTLIWGRDPKGLLDGFVRFLELVPTAKKDSRLLMIGGKSRYTDLLTLYKKEYPQIFVSDDYVPFEQTQAMQHNASVNVVLEAKSEISPFLPGKFPHCIRTGKPVLLLGPYYSECRRLLGDNYPNWSEVDDIEKMANLLSKLYKLWKTDPELQYDYKPDLLEYFSVSYLRRTIKELVYS